jgi:hypothetical protein
MESLTVFGLPYDTEQMIPFSVVSSFAFLLFHCSAFFRKTTSYMSTMPIDFDVTTSDRNSRSSGGWPPHWGLPMRFMSAHMHASVFKHQQHINNVD